MKGGRARITGSLPRDDMRKMSTSCAVGMQSVKRCTWKLFDAGCSEWFASKYASVVVEWVLIAEDGFEWRSTCQGWNSGTACFEYGVNYIISLLLHGKKIP